MIIVAAILLINTLMLTVLSHVGSHNHYFWLLLVLVLVLVFFNYGYHCYCFCFCCWPIGSTTSAVLIRILVITSFHSIITIFRYQQTTAASMHPLVECSARICLAGTRKGTLN